MQFQGQIFFVMLISSVTVLSEKLSEEKLAEIRERYCLKTEAFTTPMRESEILGSWLLLRGSEDQPCVGPSEVDVATDETKEFWRQRCSIHNEAVDIDDYDYALSTSNNTDLPFRMISSTGAKGSMLGAKCEVLSLEYRKFGSYKAWIVMGFATCGHPFPLAVYGPNKAKTRCITGYKDFNMENKKAERYTTFYC